MNFTLDELVSMALDEQERHWHVFEEAQRLNPKLIELGWVKEPLPRRTAEQIRLEIQSRFTSPTRITTDNRSTLSYRKRKY